MKTPAAHLLLVPALLGTPTVALAAGSSHVLSTQATTAVFTEAKLYEAVKAQLTAQGVAFTPNDTAHTITGDLASVTTLSLSNVQAKGTAGLEAFTGLTTLDLSHNLVSNLSGIANLTNLAVLNLYDNAVHDFSALANLTKLTTLNLGQNNEVNQGTLSGLAALNGLAALEWLDFSQNNEPSIAAQLTALSNLQYLNLQDNDITDVSGLTGLTNLSTLILSHNMIANIQPLFALTALTELNLNSNNLSYTMADKGSNEDRFYNSFKGAFNADGSFVWPQLTKLDISNNTNWGMRVWEETGKIFQLFQAGGRELAFTYDRIYQYTENGGYPYTDAKLAATVATNGGYISYDDFGAPADGTRDDFPAMANAHRYANSKACEVRATAHKTYHVYRSYDLTYYPIDTCVDWQGARFIIHDENIDFLGTRYVPLFSLHPSPVGTQPGKLAHSDIVMLEASQSTLSINAGKQLGKATVNIKGLSPELDAALADLKDKGYSRVLIEAYNDTLKQYIRFGSNSNAGSIQWDGFVVNTATGVLEIPHDYQHHAVAPVQWDFSHVTKVVLTPIPATQAYVKNGTFVSLAPTSRAEAPYGRGGGKPIYYLRNLQFRDGANVEIANIHQTVSDQPGYAASDSDLPSGSYSGFITIWNMADVKMHDCSLWARKYAQEGRSTYGLSMSSVVNATLTRVNNSNTWEQQLDMQRWGIMGNNHVKNVVFDRCVVNRIDAHEGFYNMTATGCKLGSWGFRLTGQGPLNIVDTDVTATSFIMLRADYGSTWDGDARIINCTHRYTGIWSQSLVSSSPSYEGDGSVHNFGYPLHFPNLYVENLTVDEALYDAEANGGRDTYTIVPNTDYNNLHLYPASYWPSSVEIHGLNVVNYESSMGYQPHVRLVTTERGTIADKVGGYTWSSVAFEGNVAEFDESLGSELAMNPAVPFVLTSGVTPTNRAEVTPDDFEGKVLVVEYTGELPSVALMDSGWDNFTSVGAYYYHKGSESNFAYFSPKEMAQRWEAKGATGDYAKLRVVSSGTTTVKRVLLVEPPAHTHSWGSWTRTIAPTCTHTGTEQRVCQGDPTHVETRTVSALGHDWESFFTVDVAPTETTAGSKSRHCTRCGERIDVTELPATGTVEPTPGGQGSGGAEGGSKDSGEGKDKPKDSGEAQQPEGGDEGSQGSDGAGGSQGSEGAGGSQGGNPAEHEGSGTTDGGGEASGDEKGGSSDKDNSDSARAAGWVWENGAWRYRVASDNSTTRYATGWVWDGDNWYYLQANGALTSGWLWDGAWYHLHVEHDGQFGAMDTGWVYDGGTWYFLNPDSRRGLLGRLLTGWVFYGNEWFYLNPHPDAGPRGAMCTGWMWDGNGWYYLQPSGIMLRAAFAPDGSWVDERGRWTGA